MIAELFNGTIITAEHGVMVVLGGTAIWTLERRLGNAVHDRLTRVEQRIEEIAKEMDE